MRRSRPTSPAIHYPPYYRRLLFRSVLAWTMIRGPLTAVGRELDPPVTDLHPFVSLLIVVMVVVVCEIHAHVMRERIFVANTGLGLREVAAACALPALILELIARATL